MSSSLSLSGYKLTFDSEFAAMSNSDFGLPGTPGITWETQPFYGANGTSGSDPTPPGQPGSLFSLQDGMLIENMNTTRSPYLDTNPNGVPGGFSQQYGYFEVNAKLVGSAGYNSDFWMMPNSGPWPPEFDVYEHNGYIPGDYEMTNHGGTADTPVQTLDLYGVPNLTTSFNTFGFMWTPTTLTWFINGVEVFSAPTASNENQPFNLILSGGPSNNVSWLPPPLAGSSDQYDIKWVHAYSNDPNAKGIAGMPGYQNHDGSVSLGSSTDVTSGGNNGGNGGNGSSGVIYVTPGSGSFTDASGNVYTLDAANNALENGKPMAGGSGTGAMEYANGIVYAQDEGSGTWYTWSQANDDWVQASSQPPSPTAPGGGTIAPGPVSVGSGSDTLVLSISEDAYANGDKTSDAAGDATFTVSVDGKQLAGTFTAKASHADGVDQTFTFKGDWAPGGHTVAVNFLNDAWSGTAATDRNLYVDKVTYDGTNINKSATFLRSESQSFAVTDNTAVPPPVIGAGSDMLVVKVSEDAYHGDAQFTVAVDGKQLGGTFTATMLHASGGSQAFAFAGDFGAGQHSVSVKFLNDAYAGSASTDRNLYVNDIVYNGVDTKAVATLYGAGARAFSVSGGTTPSVNETNDQGSLQKNLSQTGTYTLGGDKIVLSGGNAASVTLGTGTSHMAFIGPSSLLLTGGSGSAIVTADAGTNTFAAGAGSLDVTGGGGKDTYVFHANSGMLTIEDFSAAKGDKLTIDSGLKGSMVQGSDGQGGTLITFGSGASHAIDVHGLAAVATSSINWA